MLNRIRIEIRPRDIAREVNRHATWNVTEVHRPRKSVYVCLLYNRFNGATISPTRLYTYIYIQARIRSRHTCARGNDMYLAKCRRLWKAFRKIRSWGNRRVERPTAQIRSSFCISIWFDWAIFRRKSLWKNKIIIGIIDNIIYV